MTQSPTAGLRTRVLVVDDSAFMRTALSRMVEGEADLEVVATACSGSSALEKIVALDPDVVTLDVSMPGLDGLETLRRIMNESPRPVLMVSAGTEREAETSLAAIRLGAFDYVPKQLSPTSLDIMHIRRDLLAKIRAAGRTRKLLLTEAADGAKRPQGVVLARSRTFDAVPEVVAIGVSTGGPKALEQVLPRFGRDFPIPILIVQHMPVGFTSPLAKRLDGVCSIAVHEAIEGEPLKGGVAYIAPAGIHMKVRPGAAGSKPTLHLDRQPRNALHVPSIDVLMKSVAQVFGNCAIGVIMTGMGSDGADGMAAIFQQGGLTIGQDEGTCAVYGMPRVCAKLGILDRIVPLSDLANQIICAMRHRKHA